MIINKKLKRFLIFFAYSIFVIFIVIQVGNYGLVLRRGASATFKMFPVIIYYAITPIFYGLLLAIPYFIHETRKKGKLKFDWIKFLAIGIPSLYLVFFHLIYFFIPSLAQYIYPHRFVLLDSNIIIAFGGIVFGYLILTSLYKEVSEDLEK